jgi:BRCA1 C Terminus (BRCT) domain
MDSEEEEQKKEELKKMLIPPREKGSKISIVTSGVPESCMVLFPTCAYFFVFFSQEEVTKFKTQFDCEIMKDVNQKTTHLIVYPRKDKEGFIRTKRTVKYLKSLLLGIYIVDFVWVTDSLISGRAESESTYIVDGDDVCLGTPKQALVSKGNSSIFKGKAFVFLGQIPTVNITIKDLEDLVQMGGGKKVQAGSDEANERETYRIVITPRDNITEAEATERVKDFTKKKSYYSHKMILDTISSNFFMANSYNKFFSLFPFIVVIWQADGFSNTL